MLQYKAINSVCDAICNKKEKNKTNKQKKSDKR